MAYLDKTGLTELWKKVKSYVDANAGGTQTTITGNAGSATKLQTTRAIAVSYTHLRAHET